MNRRDRAIALNRAHTLARAHAHAHALASDLVHNLGLASDRDRDLAQALELTDDLDLYFDSPFARTLTLDLARTLTRALSLAHAITRTLNLDRALNLDRNLAHDLAQAHALAREGDHDLISALESALHRARDLEGILQAVTAQEVAPNGASSVPGRVSRGLVALAVRVLPVRDQPRYAEELREELGELPSSQRWGYALRTLCGACELRRALTETVRTADGTPARRVTEW